MLYLCFSYQKLRDLFLVSNLSKTLLHHVGRGDLRPFTQQKFRKLSLFDQMGLSVSCPLSDYDDLGENIEPLLVRSISFGDDNVKTTVRSVSFNGRDDETTILKSLGSGKMIVEGSVSFRKCDTNPLDLERMISIKAPTKENTFGSDSFKGIETGNQLSASNTLTDANPNAASSEPSSPKHEAAVKLQKVYKSFRTRRRLADCAVLVEQGWCRSLP